MSLGAYYLTYSPVNGGTLYAQYAAQDPETFVAKATGGEVTEAQLKQVKNALHSKCCNPVQYYTGCFLFVKTCVKKFSHIEFNENSGAPHKVLIALHSPDDSVQRTTSGFDLKGIDAVAFIPPQCSDYNVLKIQKSLFVSSGRRGFASSIEGCA